MLEGDLSQMSQKEIKYCHHVLNVQHQKFWSYKENTREILTKQNDHDEQNQEPEIWKSNFWGAYLFALKNKQI